MILATIVFVIFVAASLVGIGWLLVVRLDRAQRFNPFERAVFALAVGCYAVYFGVYIVGVFRYDRISMIGLTLGLGVLAIPGWRSIPWRRLRAAVAQEIHEAAGHPLTAASWLAVLATGAAYLLQGMAPPNDYDSLAYHLALPKYDLETGRMTLAWQLGQISMLYPELSRNLTRLALAAVDDGAAQMLHGVLGLVAAAGAALLALRLGASKQIALWAALFFLCIRVVLWQMATVETDLPGATFAILAMLAYLGLRDGGDARAAVLFGAMIGGGILVKYNGFPVALSFAPLIVYDLVRRRVPLAAAIVGPLVAGAVLLPHIVRNYLLTANPLHPLFNHVFNPEGPVYLKGMEDDYGVGRSLTDLLMGPWDFSIYPMRHFDGMVLGAPYLLIFVPLLALDRQTLRRALPVIGVCSVYYLMWFYQLSQQVRFLLPIMPCLAAFGAFGAHVFWNRVREDRLAAVLGVLVLGLLALNQAMFVGIYTALRLPAAVGLVDRHAYLASTPTMTGAFYEICSYVTERLSPGERYLALIRPHSYYCPQTRWVDDAFPDEAKWWLETSRPPPMTREEFLTRWEQSPFRYVIVQKTSEERLNATGTPLTITTDLTEFRFGALLVPALSGLRPIVETPTAALYEGPVVFDRLKGP